MAVGNHDLTVGEVIDIVVELLAEVAGSTPAAIRAGLEQAGAELPIDSLLIVEILARVQERCGVRVPAEAEAARSMRSVVTFAGTVVAAARAMDGEDLP